MNGIRTMVLWLPVCALLASGCDDEEDSATPPGMGDANADGGDDGAGGGGTVDNVGACESLVADLECGSADLGMYLQCDNLRASECDLGDYFTCIEETFTCNDGVFDPSGWMQCASLVTCDSL